VEKSQLAYWRCKPASGIELQKQRQTFAIKVWLGEIEAQGNWPARLPKMTIQPLSV
jgi:hypothetical protein